MSLKRTNKPHLRPTMKLLSLLALLGLVVALAQMALADVPQSHSLIGLDGFGEAGDSAGRQGPAPATPNAALILQPPNQNNALFADAGCDTCLLADPPTPGQSVADDFVLSAAGAISTITVWGVYFPADAPVPDNWTVIFHADAGGLPGAVLETQTNVPSSRFVTGISLGGLAEWQYQLTLNTPVPLTAGTYWVEIYNDTLLGVGTDDWAWETGNLDPINGRLGLAFAFDAPGIIWFLDPVRDMALQLDYTPTAVELASFSAEAQGNAILLEWETATELDSLGFNVYRSQAAEGGRLQLNPALIPAQNPGTPLGATYRFLDETATPGITYYYWLEDLDVNGTATVHGPVSGQLQPLWRLLPARPRLAPAAPGFQSR